MSNFVKATVAIIILLLIWGGTLYFQRDPIEQDLTAYVKAALSLPEFANVAVSFHGRKGTLTGHVASHDLKGEAVFGSGNVTDLLRVHGVLKMADGFDADYARFLRAERAGAVGFTVENNVFTLNMGQSEANLQMSNARAQAVYRYLTEKGVAADRLMAYGYGDRRPIADNSTSEGRQRNRRAAFRVQQPNS